MEIGHSIGKNTIVLFISQLMTWSASFVLMLFLPRYLGSVHFGLLYLAISVIMIFQILINFGGKYFITKIVAVSKDSASDLLINSVANRVVLWIISFVMMLGFAYLAGYQLEEKTLILILGISALWESVTEVFRNGFQGMEKMEYIAVSNVVQRVSLAVPAVIVLVLGAGSVTIALIMAFSAFLAFLVSVHYIRKLLSIRLTVTWQKMKNLMKEGSPYFLWSVFGVIYYRIDAVMLSKMAPTEVVGWYGAAYRFFDIIMFFPSILASVIFPVFARLWDSNDNDFVRIKQKSLEAMVLAGIPISIGIFSFAHPIIKLFFGLDQYAQTVPVLKLFSICIIPVYIDFVLGSIVLAINKQTQWSIVAFLAIFVNVGLNLLLIPYAQFHYGNGGMGAAVATTVTELFVMGSAIKLLPSYIITGVKLVVPIKSLGAGLIMISGLVLFNMLGMPWVIQGIFGLLAYLGGILLLHTLTPEEMKYLRKLFSIRFLRENILADNDTIA